MMNSRDSFHSKLGVVAAAAGAAIGLGNIWGFPYKAGSNGGGAFIVVYLLAVLLMGYPLVYTEFAIGRKTKANIIDAFSDLTGKKHWRFVGIIALVTVFLVTSFYAMLTGWILLYFIKSLTGSLYQVSAGLDTTVHFSNVFKHITTFIGPSIICTIMALAMTAFVNSAGIKKGIEKYSKILMPGLFVLFIGLIVYSFTLPGFKTAFTFLFKPDFSTITPSVIISAIGQAFFSLSLGMGALITYGSYVSNEEDLKSISRQVVIADTAIALFSGLLVFPAVFSFNLAPTAGPSLIFQSLPRVFIEITGGRWFSTLFFLFVFVAALTSLISLFEILITVVSEKTPLSRKKSSWAVFAACFIGSSLMILGEGPLSTLTLQGKTFFEFVDFITNTITIPLVGALTAISACWIWKVKHLNEELEKGAKPHSFMVHSFNFLLKWVVPFCIITLIISALF